MSIINFKKTFLFILCLSCIISDVAHADWWLEGGICSVEEPNTCKPGYYCEVRNDDEGNILYTTCQKDYCAEMDCPACCLNFTLEGQCQSCPSECSSSYSTDCTDIEPECPSEVGDSGITLTWSQKDRCLCLENFGTYFCANMTVPCCVEKEKFCPPLGGDPSGDPSDPAGDPSDPAGDPSDPAGDPSDPSGDPSDPAGDPSDPAGDPSDPSGDPSGDMPPGNEHHSPLSDPPGNVSGNDRSNDSGGDPSGSGALGGGVMNQINNPEAGSQSLDPDNIINREDPPAGDTIIILSDDEDSNQGLNQRLRVPHIAQ
jgi:hypothetical protein